MRVLFLSNIYPPQFIGGYEQLCRDVAVRLKERGHEIYIITSTYGLKRATIEGRVFRVLRISDLLHPRPQSFPRQFLIELRNVWALRAAIRKTSPDLIFIWGMRGLARSLLLEAQGYGIPTVYFLSDDWLVEKFHRSDLWFGYSRAVLRNPLKRIVKGFLRRYLENFVGIESRPLRLDHVICASHALKREYLDAGVPIEGAEVIHNGISLEGVPEPVFRSDARFLLYAGQLVEHKGVHTAIQAMARLVHEMGHDGLSLTIIGEGSLDYVNHLRSSIEEEGLADHVRFLDPVPRSELFDVLSRHDVLIFPSIRPEPLSLIMLMAMACGLTVVGTTTGGSAEVLKDGENALVFRPGNSAELASQIERALKDSKLRRKLGLAAMETVRERFDIEVMVERIERYLYQRIGSG